ncbi:tetratricopeptide repeat protein [filamentous cyanobacterium LEGE 11480]|uniref:Tetratricopeptide repeat protein n=1 Tax=Romeriopsis navalis LEGE 11480 TaxID=2777977 RepID=A0A928Z546_9CYAN|nr:tetratricopeptide repeat protein [Romeriopsis navalis]MBE9031083.1 tetratricopeptide repeat protein [Romeriopsis navalis LEGE 11480]
MATFVKTAQLAINNVPEPIVDNPKTPLMQQAAAAFEAGEAERLANHPSAALEHYGQALAISQAEGYRKFESTLWHSIAQTYALAKDYQRAETYYKTAIKLAKTTRHTEILGPAQAELAQIYTHQGQLKRALPLYRQSLANLSQTGDAKTAQHVLQQTKKVEIALKPKANVAAKAKPAKPAQPAKPKVKIAIAPETIVLPAERTTAPKVKATPDVLMTSDLDPEPPSQEQMPLVQSVVNDAM